MDAMKIAVLGCGPAGLLAAHGAAQAAQHLGTALELRVFSTKRKSPLYGCQYLHRPIPGLKLPSQRVTYKLTGTVEGYRRKVYGANEDVSVSPELLDKNHTAWDIRAAYDQLWDLYEPSIEDHFLTPGNVNALLLKLAAEHYTHVISSIPAPTLCKDRGCTFEGQVVWAQGDAPELGRWAETPASIVDGSIVCSGLPADPWYRASHVFGHGTVEYPEDALAPRGASKVTKPIDTTCDCWPGLLRVGRFGRWEKGVLADSAFSMAFEAVARSARKAA